MKKIAAVFVLSLLAWVAWRVARASGDERAPATVTEGAELAAMSADVPPVADAPAAVPPAVREPLAAAPVVVESARETALEVRLSWSDGTPASDIGLTLWRASDPRPELTARTAVTDAAGVARFDALASGPCTSSLTPSGS